MTGKSMKDESIEYRHRLTEDIGKLKAGTVIMYSMDPGKREFYPVYTGSKSVTVPGEKIQVYRTTITRTTIEEVLI
jgi:hypothetical protein